MLARSGHKPWAGRQPRVAAAASAVQTTSTARSPWSTSPVRPASGAVSNRTAVPAPSTRPSCAADNPRAWTKAGRKGDATPKAAYIAAYSSRKRGSAIDRRACPSGLRITTTGALLNGHGGNKAQIRGLRRNNDVSGPRSLLVTTVPPGPSSARVILRRAALGRPRPTRAQSLGPPCVRAGPVPPVKDSTGRTPNGRVHAGGSGGAR
jgi:hypothetical protein